MYKTIAAIIAIAITGAFTLAQDSERAEPGWIPPESVEIEEGELVVTPFEYEEDVEMLYVPQPLQMGRPGTWEIVTHDDWVLLFNSSTGQTFHLEDNDDGVFWKPVPGPGHQPERRRADRPRMPDMPRPVEPERLRRDRDLPNREDLERKLDGLRERMKKARGDSRERLEKAIHEVEKMLEKRRKMRGEGDRDREWEERERPRRDPEWEERRDREHREGADRRERMVDELEEIMEEIEDRLGELEDELDETDNRRKRRALEEAIDELREEAERLRDELDELRD